MDARNGNIDKSDRGIGSPFIGMTNRGAEQFRREEARRREMAKTEAILAARAERKEREKKKNRRKLTVLGVGTLSVITAVGLAFGMDGRAEEAHGLDVLPPENPVSASEPGEYTDPMDGYALQEVTPEIEVAENAPVVEEEAGLTNPETEVEKAEIIDPRVAEFSENAWAEFNEGGLDLNESDVGNMITVYQLLLERSEEEDLSGVHIAGIMGNMYQENRFRTEDGDPSMGLLQWEGPRKTALYSYAQENGLDPEELQTQVDFMFWERYNSLGEGANWDKFLETDTIEEATVVFCERIERAGTPAMENRTKYANQIANFAGIEDGQ